MPVVDSSPVHVNSILGLIGFVILWIALVACVKLLIAALRNDPLIGWAIGPLGFSTLYLNEPSALFILFSALFPVIVSAVILYFGLFSSLPSPLTLPHTLFVEILVIGGCVLLTSIGDLRSALRDLRHPLWGEARILRTIQFLRASWASIHFTAFGISFLQDHFDSNPTDLLQAF